MPVSIKEIFDALLKTKLDTTIGYKQLFEDESGAVVPDQTNSEVYKVLLSIRTDLTVLETELTSHLKHPATADDIATALAKSMSDIGKSENNISDDLAFMESKVSNRDNIAKALANLNKAAADRILAGLVSPPPIPSSSPKPSAPVSAPIAPPAKGAAPPPLPSSPLPSAPIASPPPAKSPAAPPPSSPPSAPATPSDKKDEIIRAIKALDNINDLPYLFDTANHDDVRTYLQTYETNLKLSSQGVSFGPSAPAPGDQSILPNTSAIAVKGAIVSKRQELYLKTIKEELKKLPPFDPPTNLDVLNPHILTLAKIDTANVHPVALVANAFSRAFDDKVNGSTSTQTFEDMLDTLGVKNASEKSGLAQTFRSIAINAHRRPAGISVPGVAPPPPPAVPTPASPGLPGGPPPAMPSSPVPTMPSVTPSPVPVAASPMSAEDKAALVELKTALEKRVKAKAKAYGEEKRARIADADQTAGYDSKAAQLTVNSDIDSSIAALLKDPNINKLKKAQIKAIIKELKDFKQDPGATAFALPTIASINGTGGSPTLIDIQTAINGIYKAAKTAVDTSKEKYDINKAIKDQLLIAVRDKAFAPDEDTTTAPGYSELAHQTKIAEAVEKAIDDILKNNDIQALTPAQKDQLILAIPDFKNAAAPDFLKFDALTHNQFPANGVLFNRLIAEIGKAYKAADDQIKEAEAAKNNNIKIKTALVSAVLNNAKAPADPTPKLPGYDEATAQSKINNDLTQVIDKILQSDAVKKLTSSQADELVAALTAQPLDLKRPIQLDTLTDKTTPATPKSRITGLSTPELSDLQVEINKAYAGAFKLANAAALELKAAQQAAFVSKIWDELKPTTDAKNQHLSDKDHGFQAVDIENLLKKYQDVLLASGKDETQLATLFKDLLSPQNNKRDFTTNKLFAALQDLKLTDGEKTKIAGAIADDILILNKNAAKLSYQAFEGLAEVHRQAQNINAKTSKVTELNKGLLGLSLLEQQASEAKSDLTARAAFDATWADAKKGEQTDKEHYLEAKTMLDKLKEQMEIGEKIKLLSEQKLILVNRIKGFGDFQVTPIDEASKDKIKKELKISPQDKSTDPQLAEFIKQAEYYKNNESRLAKTHRELAEKVAVLDKIYQKYDEINAIQKDTASLGATEIKHTNKAVVLRTIEYKDYKDYQSQLGKKASAPAPAAVHLSSPTDESFDTAKKVAVEKEMHSIVYEVGNIPKSDDKVNYGVLVKESPTIKALIDISLSPGLGSASDHIPAIQAGKPEEFWKDFTGHFNQKDIQNYLESKKAKGECNLWGSHASRLLDSTWSVAKFLCEQHSENLLSFARNSISEMAAAHKGAFHIRGTDKDMVEAHIAMAMALQEKYPNAKEYQFTNHSKFSVNDKFPRPEILKKAREIIQAELELKVGAVTKAVDKPGKADVNLARGVITGRKDMKVDPGKLEEHKEKVKEFKENREDKVNIPRRPTK
ncbi:MAG: hypothetical protein ACYCQI_09780 [Gammaproteobacteria bacterium]